MKRKGLLTLLTLCSSMLLGIFAFVGNNSPITAKATTEIEGDIIGVQVRAAMEQEMHYIVVQDASIKENDGAIGIRPGYLSNYTAPDYIKVYTAPLEYVMLSSIIDTTQDWNVNLWNSLGVMFPLSTVTYQTYNAATIYALEVLPGATYPNSHSQTVVNNKQIKYLNKNYENTDPEGIVSSWEWEEEKPFIRNENPLYLIGAQVRADSQHGLYYIDLMSNTYKDATKKDYYALYRINAYSKIKIYLSENGSPITLENVTSLRNGLHNEFDNVPAFFFALTSAEYDIYNGTTIYAIDVESDCELIVDGAVSVTNKSYRFKNNSYGDASAKYENFNFAMEVSQLL